MQDLALRHQVLDGPGDILDRHLRVDAVLVQEIDTIGPQAPQHALDGELDAVRTAVETRTPLARLQIDVPAELRRDDDLVAERRDGFAEDPLAPRGGRKPRPQSKKVTPRSKAVRMMLSISGRLGIVV